jgi:hypothetical protein
VGTAVGACVGWMAFRSSVGGRKLVAVGGGTVGTYARGTAVGSGGTDTLQAANHKRQIKIRRRYFLIIKHPFGNLPQMNRDLTNFHGIRSVAVLAKILLLEKVSSLFPEWIPAYAGMTGKVVISEKAVFIPYIRVHQWSILSV